MATDFKELKLAFWKLRSNKSYYISFRQLIMFIISSILIDMFVLLYRGWRVGEEYYRKADEVSLSVFKHDINYRINLSLLTSRRRAFLV